MFEVTRRKEYKKFALILRDRIRQNKTISPKERQKMEQEINRCIKKLDLHKMLDLYSALFPEYVKELLDYL